MPFTKLAFSTFAAVILLAAHGAIAEDAPIVVDPAIATMTVDQMVEARQAAMKQDGGLLRSAGTLTGDDAVAAATTLLQNFTNFPALFPEGSINDKSGALPVIWEKFDDFTAIFAKDAETSKAMLVAAQTGDMEGYTAAIKAIGASCGECHQTYRKPK